MQTHLHNMKNFKYQLFHHTIFVIWKWSYWYYIYYHKITYRIPFSPFNMWISRVELRFSIFAIYSSSHECMCACVFKCDIIKVIYLFEIILWYLFAINLFLWPQIPWLYKYCILSFLVYDLYCLFPT